MNRLISRRLGAILACLTILAIFGTIGFPTVVSATDNVMAEVSPSGISIRPSTAVIDSTNTRLLVTLSKYNSIDELKKPPGYRTLIGLGSNSEIPWLGTALNSYGIDYFPIMISESEADYALIRGVIDAYLVTTHPSPYLQTGIESEVFRLLPWSEEAVAAVVEASPDSVIPAQLPANTYAGQSDAILGYMSLLQLQPITLTQDFTLTSDMTFTDTGFIIGADNITLNLNGHTITGSYAPIPSPPEPYTTGVQLDGYSGVTIKNGTIRGFNHGIALSNSDGNVIKGIVATDNTATGLAINGSNNNVIEGVVATGNIYDGMMVGGSSNNVVKGVVSSDNGRWGIQITSGSDNNEVLGSTFANNGSIQTAGGVIIVASNGNLVKGCTSTGNNTVGVRVRGGPTPPPPDTPVPSTGNIVRDSTITNNNFMGISLYIADSNSIIGNTISNNQPAGIELSCSDSNTINSNTIDENGAAGIVIATEADSNEIRANRIGNNGLNGIRFGAPPLEIGEPPANNTINGNTIAGNGRNGVIITNGAHDNEIGNNTIKGNGINGIFVGAAPPPPPSTEPPPTPPLPPSLPPVDPGDNQITGNKLSHNATYDIQDITSGDGDFGTANFYEDNKGKTSDPAGLVQ